MSLFNSIAKIFTNNPTPTAADVPEDFCPNCWGRNEYGGKFYEAMKNENVDINNVNEKKGWIQDYADKNLSMIQLKHTDTGAVCAKCKVTYTEA